MAGMNPDFGRSGKSHRFNRVTFPSFSEINQTYEKLPGTYNVGMISEIEDAGLKAVLCKNGGSQINKWLLTESNQIWFSAVDIPIARRNQRNVVVDAGSTAVAENSLVGGYIWITDSQAKDGIPSALKEDGAGNHTGFRKLLIMGNSAKAAGNLVTIQVAGLNFTINDTTDVTVQSSMYWNTQVTPAAAVLANKPLGVTVLPIPANHYYWAVFYGDMTVNAGSSAAAGAALTKGNNGALDAATASTILVRDIIGHVRHQGTPDIVTLDIRGVDLQDSQKQAA